MDEHRRIAQYFAPLTLGEPGSFALTDDAAILTSPAGYHLVITTDSVIEAIHVLPHATPQQFAQKLVRRNLSDLAAMGATPWRYTINLHTPIGLHEDWFAQFTAALSIEQTTYTMVLIGGDSTSGGTAIHASMTCLGLIDGTPLRRNGAQAGDDLYVSGTLGDAAYALHLLQQNMPLDAALADRYHTPTPRLQLGKMLRSIASAAMDISDGLMADLAHLCAASKVGASIHKETLPLSHYLRPAIAADAAHWRYPVSGGDDYELLFTAHHSQRAAIQQLAATLNLPLTRIGHIHAEPTTQLLDANGTPLTINHTGWTHG